LEKLPLTANGKIDRKTLPAPEGDVYVRRRYDAPSSETEAVLAAIWSDLLTADRVGRNDHFFELGGHSLLAVKLIDRMRQHGMSVDVRTVFIAPTLAALAQAVDSQGAFDTPVAAGPPPRETERPYTLRLTI
jgi:aryl carrier-like protein